MRLKWACLFALTIMAAGQPGHAAQTLPTAAPFAVSSADIPFDPPLDSKVRFRWEKAVQRKGVTDMNWSVADYRFEQAENGFRLTITPVSSGSNETDPVMLAIMKRLDELTRRPFVLTLNENGEIESLEDADLYWSAIFKAMKEEMAKDAKSKKDPKFLEIMENVLGMFQKMPAEARQALLTEDVQPVLEFGNSHTEIGKPLIATVATASPYGGSINREVTVSLKKVEGSTAYLSVGSKVPRAELDRLVKSFLKQMTALPTARRKDAEKAMTSFEKFRHDTLSEYEVSIDDGLLQRFQSTETIEVRDEDQQGAKITTRSMTRIEPR